MEMEISATHWARDFTLTFFTIYQPTQQPSLVLQQWPVNDDADVDDEPPDTGSELGHGCGSGQHADGGTLSDEHGGTGGPRR